MDLNYAWITNWIVFTVVWIFRLGICQKYERVDITAGDKDQLLSIDDQYGGIIYVGAKGDKYGKGVNASVLINAYKLPTSQMYSDFKTYVGFKFNRFDIPDKWPWSGTCGDFVEIFQDTLSNVALTSSGYNSGICADLYKAVDDNFDFFTNSETAIVRFISDVAVEGSGFDLIFTSFYKSDGSSCYSEDGGEFYCDNGNCVAQSVRCDKLNNCGDNSDERNCVYEDSSSDFVNEVIEKLLANYALVIAVISFVTMISSMILAFCVRVICQDETKALRKKKKGANNNVMVGADGKKIINPNLKAPVYRKNPGL